MSDAIHRASAFLRQQAATGFAELRHEMRFPRLAGFTGAEDLQVSDVFARAVVASLLLDVAEAPATEAALADECRAIARREADYVASRRLDRCAGGWSYFPDLPELPPDLDSLSAALLLFSRIAPHWLARTERPISLALGGASPDGAIETWLVAPEDGEAATARMRWGIEHCWGRGPDVDVLAHFYLALASAHPLRYAGACARGAAWIERQQGADGSWPSTWYANPTYVAGVCLRLLRLFGASHEPARRALTWLRNAQHRGGGWGPRHAWPLDTALGAWAAHMADPEAGRDLVRAAAALLEAHQNPDGSWPPSPWIQMPIGRASGRVARVATYHSVTVTTAFCLRTLAVSAP